MDQFGFRLRTLRKARGLTLEDVAQRFHIQRSSVSDWERNETLPSVSRVVELAILLNTSIEYLLTGNPNAAWLFPEVNRERVATLDTEELALVSIALNSALTMVEARAAQAKKSGTKS